MAGTDHDHRKRRRAALQLAAGLCCAGVASPAMGDVIEISASGSTAVRSGAGAVRWSGAGAGDTEMPADIDVPAGAVLSTAPRAPATYAAAVARIAAKYDISPAILEALVWQESRWHPNAVSPAGAVGLAQLMPATARAMAVDPRDPAANLDGAARYLRVQLNRFDGDIERALAAYNAGPGRVVRAGGIPPIAETRTYVAAIIGRLATTPTGE